MSGLGVTHIFFSHYQVGAATGTLCTDQLPVGAPPPPIQARIVPNIQLQLVASLGGPNAKPVTVPPITAPVQLYGPGDVGGLQNLHIARTDPQNLETSFDPTCFPAIEFDDPGFPWLFTPVGPTDTPHAFVSAQGVVNPDGSDLRLRPWIVLIVLADGEFEQGTDSAHPSITGLSIDKLPDLGDSWAWAHVQVTGEMNGRRLDEVIATDPSLVRARIMCPRNLQPNTHYTAFLVPAFDAGIWAALGTPPNPPAATVSPAWSAGANPPVLPPMLPYFYSFEFNTSAAGDFATLVRRLQPRQLSGVGSRLIETDIGDAAWGTPPVTASKPDLALGGALALPDSLTPAKTMLEDIDASFITALEALINHSVPPTSTGGPDPQVVPPLYGRWQKGVSSVNKSSGWLNELNLDPRWRVAAGFGSRVVVSQRDQLMAAAWDQLGSVRRANQLLRQAQLSRAALGQSFQRVYQTRTAAAQLALTAPLHARLRWSSTTDHHARLRLPATTSPPITVLGRIAPSNVPQKLLSPQARRLFRARGPLGSRTKSLPNTAGPLTLTGLVTQITALKQPFSGWDTIASDPATFPQSTIPSLSLSPLPTIMEALDPTTTLATAVKAQITSSLPNWVLPRSDPLEPIMAYPVFDTPMAEPLAAMDEQCILPGANNIPPDTVGALGSDSRFIKAYMVGLSHEMGRQLLFHRYPSDQMGTYFLRFWNRENYVPIFQQGTVPSPPQDELNDIPEISAWPTAYELDDSMFPGGTKSAPAENVVLIVRGQLLNRYPNTIIYAAQAMSNNVDGQPKYVPDPNTIIYSAQAMSNNMDVQPKHVPDPHGKQCTPLFRGTLPPDITYLGFSLTPGQVRGDATHPGWFFVFQNHPSEPSFGLQGPTQNVNPSAPLLTGNFASIAVGLTSAAPPASQSVVASPSLARISAIAVQKVIDHLKRVQPAASGNNSPPVGWGQSAAAMARSLLIQPERVFMHGELIVPRTKRRKRPR